MCMEAFQSLSALKRQRSLELFSLLEQLMYSGFNFFQLFRAGREVERMYFSSRYNKRL